MTIRHILTIAATTSIAACALTSCDWIKDDLSDCPECQGTLSVKIEHRYNMLHADAAPSRVEKADVFIRHGRDTTQSLRQGYARRVGLLCRHGILGGRNLRLPRMVRYRQQDLRLGYANRLPRHTARRHHRTPSATYLPRKGRCHQRGTEE